MPWLGLVEQRYQAVEVLNDGATVIDVAPSLWGGPPDGARLAAPVCQRWAAGLTDTGRGPLLGPHRWLRTWRRRSPSRAAGTRGMGPAYDPISARASDGIPRLTLAISAP